MLEISDFQTFTIVHCYKCHIAFGLPKSMQIRCRETGDEFHCPNGHGQVYATSEVEKLKKQLARKEEDVQYYIKRNGELWDEKAHVERQLSAKKGQITKIKNRVAKGVCPCCNRTFQNLARHMESQHPGWYSASGNPATAETASSNDQQ